MANGIDAADAAAGTGMTGIFTLTSSDLQTINDIERMRADFMMQLGYADPYESLSELKSLLSSMQILMSKYDFHDSDEDVVKTKYDFYYVKDTIDMTEGDPELIRRACEIAFADWEKVLQRLGVALPTSHGNFKKRLVAALYAMIPKKKYGGMDAFTDKMVAEYDAAVKKDGVDKTKFGFMCYIVSRMREFDLPCKITIAGRKRSSKSTCAGYIVKNVYADRKETLDNKYFVDHNIYYSNKQQVDITRREQINWYDESYKTHDKRTSMRKSQIIRNEDDAFYASLNNIDLNLIQMYEDFDKRVLGTYDLAVMIDERGHGFLFCEYRWLSLSHSNIFQRFIDHPELLDNAAVGKHMIKQLPGFLCEITWPDQNPKDEFWILYDAKKKEWQNKPITEGVNAETPMIAQVMALYNKGWQKARIAEKLHITQQYTGRLVKSALTAGQRRHV
jgi:hypothetical protein